MLPGRANGEAVRRKRLTSGEGQRARDEPTWGSGCYHHQAFPRAEVREYVRSLRRTPKNFAGTPPTRV